MKKHYQQEHNAYDSFQAYSNEQEENRQRMEYRDLYDPFKSSWKVALGGEQRTASERGAKKRNQEYPGAQEQANLGSAANKSGSGSFSYTERYSANLGYSPYDSNEGSYEQPSGRGYTERYYQKWGSADKADSKHETSRNTYGYYTTGYGPRD